GAAVDSVLARLRTFGPGAEPVAAGRLVDEARNSRAVMRRHGDGNGVVFDPDRRHRIVPPARAAGPGARHAAPTLAVAGRHGQARSGVTGYAWRRNHLVPSAGTPVQWRPEGAI